MSGNTPLTLDTLDKDIIELQVQLRNAHVQVAIQQNDINESQKRLIMGNKELKRLLNTSNKLRQTLLLPKSKNYNCVMIGAL